MKKQLLKTLVISLSLFFSTSSHSQNNALDFDGTDDYVSIGSILGSASPYTKEAWIYADAVSDRNIISSVSDKFFISATGNLSASHGGSVVAETFTITPGSWIHVAVTYDGFNTVRLYKNGMEVAMSNTITPSSGGPIDIGGSGSGYFDGKMDEMRIWHIQRSSFEIQSNMYTPMLGNEFGLDAYYGFNQGIAGGNNTGLTTLYDYAGTPDNGTLNGPFALTGSTSNWVQGNCNPTAQINLKGNNITIVNGSTTTSTADNTDFGFSDGFNPVQKSFTIENTGSSTLKFSMPIVVNDPFSAFNIMPPPNLTVAAGSSTNFDVQFNHPFNHSGDVEAMIKIFSDDCEEYPYTFNVKGTGPIRNALNFDGIDDYVSLPNAGSLDFGTSTPFTIEAWVKTNTGALTGIISKSISGPGTEIQILKTSGGQTEVKLNTLLGYCGFTGSQNIADNNWHHIALVVDRAAPSAKLYVDGMFDAQTSGADQSNLTGDFNTFTAFNFGVDKNSSANYAGDLDEVRIWSFAKRQCDIQSQNYCELTGSEPNLLAYYNFNQGIPATPNYSQTILNDAAGTAENGTLNNFALSSGVSNWIAAMNSVNGGCPPPPLNPEINVKGNGVDINHGSTATSGTNNTEFGVYSGSAIVKTFTIENTGPDELSIWSVNITPIYGTPSFMVTASPALTVASGSNTTFDISFNHMGSDTIKAQVSINSNDCDENPYTFVIAGTGPIRNSLGFDGADDYVSLPNDAALEFGTSTPFTIEAWVKPTGGGTNSGIIAKQYGGPNSDIQISKSPGGNVFVDLKTPLGLCGFSGTAFIADNDWHHIALVVDRTAPSAILYVDGMLDAQTSGADITNLAGDMNTGTGFRFGTDKNATDYFAGELDEVRIWNVARPYCDILSNVFCELNGSEPNLVAYYNFNQGSPATSNYTQTTLNDIAGTPQNGTLNNFALSSGISNWLDASMNGINGTCLSGLPEINIKGNGISIINGDITPDVADNTDLGNVPTGMNKAVSFTIENTGTANLSLPGSNSVQSTGPYFWVMQPNTNSIAPSSSATFTVNFNPSISGLQTSTITINTTDCDEGEYLFVIQGNGCTPPPAPMDVTPASNLTICAGNATTLSATGIETISWYDMPYGGSYLGGGSSFTTAPLYGMITFWAQDSIASCGAGSRTPISVHVNNTPNITISGANMICEGSSTTLTAGEIGGGPLTYMWLNGGETTASITVSPVSNTTYSVMGTDMDGCSGFNNFIVNVSPNPTVTITGLNTICSGSNTMLNAGGANIYLWSPGGETTNIINVSPVGSTSYTVTGTDFNGCMDMDMINVTVNANPTITVSPDGTICFGNLMPLNASGADSYLWAPGNLNGSSVNVSPPTTTTFSVVGTNTVTMCYSATKMVNVAVNQLPTVNINGPAAICMGGTASLTGSGAITYMWLPGGQNTSSIMDSPVISTNYTLTGTDVNGCSNFNTFFVNVNPNPTVTIGGLNSICSGQMANLNASGANTYLWYPGNETTNNINVSPVVSTSYTVTGTDFNGCVDIDAIIVTVNANPTISVSPDGTICFGNIIPLSASGADNYAWMPGNLNGSSVNVSPPSTTTFSVVGTNMPSMCSSSTQLVTVTVNQLPSVNINGPGAICTGQMANLTASGSFQYLWSNGSTESSIQVSPSSSMAYTVTATDVNNCSGMNFFFVNVNSNPTITITGTNTICVGQNTFLNAMGANTYLWSTGASTPSINVTPTVSSTYTVTGTDFNGCVDMKTRLITVNTRPTVSISANVTSICKGESTTISASGANTYIWSTNEIGSSIVAMPFVNTSYSVIGTDINNCPDTSSAIEIIVTPASITGEVSFSGGLVAGNALTFAKLFRYDLFAEMMMLDSVGLSSGGVYIFDQLSKLDTSIVYIQADPTTYPNTFGTYYAGTFEWTGATKVVPTCPSTSANITLVETVPLIGTNRVKGKIVEGQGYGKKAGAGEGIGGVDVGLKKKPGGELTSTAVTDANGDYEMNNLPDGDYEMYINIPGLPIITNYTISLSASNPEETEVDFEVDSNQIETTTTTSIKHISRKSSIQVFPNPAQDIIYVALESSVSYKLNVEIVDVLGKTIKTSYNNVVPQGVSFLQLNTSDLAEGIYWINLIAEDRRTTEKLSIIR